MHLCSPRALAARDGWLVRELFRAMGSERQRKHLDVVATFCEAARAASVVLVEDAPGYFEDRIAVEDESTLVDAVLPVGAVAEILEVWTTAPDLSVEGCTAWKHGNVARFHRHLVAPAPSPRS